MDNFKSIVSDYGQGLSIFNPKTFSDDEEEGDKVAAVTKTDQVKDGNASDDEEMRKRSDQATAAPAASA